MSTIQQGVLHSMKIPLLPIIAGELGVSNNYNNYRNDCVEMVYNNHMYSVSKKLRLFLALLFLSAIRGVGWHQFGDP